MNCPKESRTAGAAVRVVVVDDSLLMRELLQSALIEAGDITVVGAAANPHAAREVIRATDPDVVTLDVEMPSMGGLEFLRRIMKLRPMPVVMVTGTTAAGAETTLAALEIGAVDFVAKPRGRAGWEDFAATVRAKVREAANIRFDRPALLARAPASPAPAARPVIPAAPGGQPCRAGPKHSGPARPSSARAGRGPIERPDAALPHFDLIAVGASTGGVAAINRLLAGRPGPAWPGMPPVVIAQHMPPGFTARLAERLARATGLDVAEASDREVLERGTIRIAPGDRHLRVARHRGRLICRLGDDPPVGNHRPSIDVLFTSVAAALGKRAAGVILTGMGSDGAKGLARMRLAGAHTFGEAEKSCTVYGMPKAAMRLGAVAEEHGIDGLAERLLGQPASAQADPGAAC
ncbi:MAG: chemotaxis-specific protein-glutamate methyltransferase CheB [Alphaproteobacteria bacterium]